MYELVWLVGISSLFFALAYCNGLFMILSRYLNLTKKPSYVVDENSNGFDAEYHHVCGHLHQADDN